MGVIKTLKSHWSKIIYTQKENFEYFAYTLK